MLRNFILETANNPGSGVTVNLAGAATGRMAWGATGNFATGATVYYIMTDGTQGEWGWGVYTSGSPNTLTRTTVIGNTSGNTTRLNFTGSVQVYNELPAEKIGEYISNSATAVSLSNGVAANLCTVSLPPGEWDVFANCYFHPAGTTTVSSLNITASPTSASGITYSNGSVGLNLPFLAGQGQLLASGVLRVNNVSAANQTIYCVASANFGVSTMTADGSLQARRAL